LRRKNTGDIPNKFASSMSFLKNSFQQKQILAVFRPSKMLLY
jgi:hypothetical protein